MGREAENTRQQRHVTWALDVVYRARCELLHGGTIYFTYHYAANKRLADTTRLFGGRPTLRISKDATGESCQRVAASVGLPAGQIRYL